MSLAVSGELSTLTSIPTCCDMVKTVWTQQCGLLNRDKRGEDRHLGSCALPKHPRGANLSEITPGCISEPRRCSQCVHGRVAGP